MFSYQASSTSYACAKDAQIKTIYSGLEVELETNPNGNWLIISVPQNLEGFSLTNTEIVIGNITQPNIIFALKMVKRGNNFIGSYFSKEVDKSSKVYATYGGQCSGVMVVQHIYT